MNNSNQNAGVKPKFLNATPAVAYVGRDYTVFVPNTAPNSTGDLSKLPVDLRDKLEHYSENGFTQKEMSVDSSISTPHVPPAQKILNDFNAQGYSIDDVKVYWQEEVDEKGNKRPSLSIPRSGLHNRFQRGEEKGIVR